MLRVPHGGAGRTAITHELVDSCCLATLGTGWEGWYVLGMENENEMNWTLEVVVVPVSDLDRSLAFYRDQFGFHLDHDYDLGEGRRVVQLTPPGSGCSMVLGAGGVVPEMPPGSMKGLQLVVSDIERAHRILTERKVETSGVQVLGENPEPTAHPLDNVGMIFLSDPDGNAWAIQQMSSRGR